VSDKSTIVSGGIQIIYTVSQKTRCRIFVITSSTVNRFWKFCYCWKQQWIIIYKINIIFFAASC